jgi:hypothetical protein
MDKDTQDMVDMVDMVHQDTADMAQGTMDTEDMQLIQLLISLPSSFRRLGGGGGGATGIIITVDSWAISDLLKLWGSVRLRLSVFLFLWSRKANFSGRGIYFYAIYICTTHIHVSHFLQPEFER